jgi:hypothetical protein
MADERLSRRFAPHLAVDSAGHLFQSLVALDPARNVAGAAEKSLQRLQNCTRATPLVEIALHDLPRT